MPSQLLIDYLQRSGAEFSTLDHPAAFTAQQVVNSTEIARSTFAKVVMVRVDGELSMVVLPAGRQVDLLRLRRALQADSVELASERQFRYRFPRCETGSMPPFGHLFGLEGYLLPMFNPLGDIVFNAGSYTQAIRMPYAEFIRFAHLHELSELGLSRPEEGPSPQKSIGARPCAPQTLPPLWNALKEPVWCFE